MPRTFTLVRTLGRGAHGAVHLAEMRDDDEYVQTLAVKRLLPEWSTDPDLLARLKDEARLLALLQHEHVVRVHGLTRIDGGVAILMEAVDGVDLGRLVARHGALAPRVALEVVRAVADALDAAWTTAPPGRDALRVVHRDIKPSNVMLTPRGGVKVMDFGVARATFDAREGETRSQQFGTARYMAPERWLHGEAEHRSDVFSLGVTLIEIASGVAVPRLRLSPDGFADDRAAALAGVRDDAVRALAERMTAYDPAERPTAAEVVTACDAGVGGAPGPTLRVWAADAVRPEPGEAVDPTCTATVVREDTASRSASIAAPLPARRWRWGALAAAAGFAVTAAGVAALTRPPPAAPEVAVPAELAVIEPAPVQGVRTAPTPVVVPAPAAVPRPVAPPPPAPPPPEVAPPVPTVTFRFLFEDPGLVVETDHGEITRSPAVLSLPANSVVEIRVREGSTVRSCNINVGAHAGEVRIRKGGVCSQSS